MPAPLRRRWVLPAIALPVLAFAWAAAAAGSIAQPRPTPPATPLSQSDVDPETLPAHIRAPTAAEKAELDRLSIAANTAAGEERWQDLEALAQRKLALEERTFGPAHRVATGTLSWIAHSRYKRRDYAGADHLLRRALASARAEAGAQHPLVAAIEESLAMSLSEQGRADEAEPLFRSALASGRAAFGDRNEEVAKRLNNLGMNLAALQRLDEAEPLLRRALEVRQAVLGPDAAMTLLTAENLASILTRLGRRADAETLYRTLFEARRRAFGDDSAEAAASAFALGATLHAQDKSTEAEPYIARAVRVRLAIAGPRDVGTAISRGLHASILDVLGRFAEAEALHRQALEVFGSNPDVSDDFREASLNNLGLNLTHQGRYSEAEDVLQQALAATTARYGERHSRTATSYASLGANLSAQGRYQQAEPLLRRALEITEALGGGHHPNLGSSLDNLGANFYHQKKYDEAAVYYTRALEIHLAAYGERHLRTATSYNNLGLNLSEQGRPADAEPLLRRALASYRAALGEQHSLTSTAYGNLALSLAAQRRFADAEAPFRRALEIDLQVLGDRHPDTARSYANLAHNHHDRKAHADAVDLGRTALRILRAHRSLATPTSAAAEAARRSASDYAFSNFLAAAWARATQAPAEAPALRGEAFTAAQDMGERAAGQALALAAARIAAGRAGVSAIVRRRQDLAVIAQEQDARLLQALGAGDGAAAATARAELRRVGDELAGLDDELRSKFPSYAELTSAQAASLDDVRRRLQPGEGLLLLVPAGADVHLFAVSRTNSAWVQASRSAARTAGTATILRCQVDPETCGEVAAALKRGAAGAFETAVVDRVRSFDRARAYGLYRELVQPVEGALEGVKTLYVVTSGPLSGLPLGLLLTEPPEGGANADASPETLAGSKWLADRYSLVTLPSVSSLRALGALKAQPGTLALAGFGSPSLKTMASLPETETELRTMASALGAPASAVRLGPAATETAVKTSPDLAQARVVIFATHGLLPRELKGLEEPGLVFTPPAAATAEDDGVLTASEAARLNLSADWVILSACNTAAADGTPGAESLSGLAKAFLYAGAQALLASHWRVADDSTSVLTVQTLAIQKANPTFSKAQALQAAMKAVRTGKLPDGSPLPGWKPQWAHPAAWAPFTLVSAGG